MKLGLEKEDTNIAVCAPLEHRDQSHPMEQHEVVSQMADPSGMDVVEEESYDYMGVEQDDSLSRGLMQQAFSSLVPDYTRLRHNWLDFGVALQLGGESVLRQRSADPPGWTPLHFAAYHNKVDYTKLLITRGAEIGAKAQFSGDTPLLACARRGDRCAEVVIALLRANADLHATCTRGARTPLHLAASMGNVQLMRIFLDWGARPTQRADFVQQGHNRMSSVAIIACATPLCDAVRMARLDAAKLLIDAGVDPMRDESRPSVAEVAARKGAAAMECFRFMVAYSVSKGTCSANIPVL